MRCIVAALQRISTEQSSFHALVKHLSSCKAAILGVGWLSLRRDGCDSTQAAMNLQDLLPRMPVSVQHSSIHYGALTHDISLEICILLASALPV